MTVAITNPIGTQVAGWQYYGGLEESGQLNIYEPLQTDLQPFFIDDTDYLSACFKVAINAAIRVDNPDFSRVSKRSGYPDRYDWGQFRWLSGGNALELQLVDTIQWQEPIIRQLWVTKTGDPDRTFPNGNPTELNSYDFVESLSCNGFGVNMRPVGRISCEEFAWYINGGNVFDIVIYFFAQRQDLLKADLPSGPIPAYFFFM